MRTTEGHRITRRSLMQGSVAATMVLGAGAAVAQSKPVMILLSSIDITNFDPHVATGYASVFMMRNLYDSLVGVEGDPPQIVPRLAQHWTISADAKTYTFTIDQAAKFNDGTPVDAQAVRYSFLRTLRLNRGNNWMVADILTEDGIEAVDAATVHFTLRTPFAPFLEVLPWFWIVNPKQVEAHKGDDDGQSWLRANVAGSGPFLLQRAETGNLYLLERAPQDWRQGGGNLASAIWKITRESSTQRMMIQRGDAHMAIGLTSEDMDALKGRPGLDLVIRNEYRTFQMKMNTRHGLLQDANLRRAVSCAFDYEAMLQVNEYSELLSGPLPSQMFGFDKALKPWRRDLDQAHHFLSQSSLPNGGGKLKITYLAGYEQERRWALILLDSLKALNIDLDIVSAPWPDLVASARTPETLADFFPVYQIASYSDPDNLAFAGYHSSRNGGFTNPVYANPEVDAVIVQARQEPDPAKRAILYAKFQDLVMGDACDLFGVVEKRKLALRDTVHGYRFTPIAGDAPELFGLSIT